MADRIARAMVVTAHPDDSEFGAGGTVAKLVKDGCEVTYVVVTNGNKGSSDRSMTPERLAAIRADEQRNAARTLGVARVELLGYPDGEVEDTRDLRRDVSRQIRKWRPDLLICQNPNRTYNLGPEFEPHKVKHVYVMQWQNPQLVVDITDVIDVKLRALACHASQFSDVAALQERVRQRAAELGKAKDYAYAECFDHIVMG
ncbi:MAG: PIG-L family deacetylase [Candidatus Rokuibacteriota bacterium]|nr:MAG: PIG-L family deacetylase [Candidatus Rokubacteria bacterium]